MDDLKILILDSDTSYRNNLKSVLDDEFNVETSGCSESAINLVSATSYHIILLDISLANKSDFKLVSQLKLQSQDLLPILFMTSTEYDAESVISCFEAGASSYIKKTCDTTELKYKLRSIKSYITEINATKAQSDELESIVSITMHQANSYGWALDLITSVIQCRDFETLAKKIAASFQSIGIQTCIEISTPNDSLFYDSSTKIASPIIIEMFELLRNKGRIYSFNQRTIFNDKYISILVKNMPNDETLSSIYIDSFAKLIPALTSRIQNMLDKHKIVETRTQLVDILTQLEPAIIQVQQEKQQLLDKMIAEVGVSFHTLDFNDAQEAFIAHILQEQLLKQGQIDMTIHSIISKIEKVMNGLPNISIENEETAQTVEVDNSVELF
ncbi:response regulator transcription factor [Catenovulum maritimum]|uniref:Response regulatory domain-containing protein n=1 Tax=Catenovulum maritimum TaxID=1513271 RepID=A0A0J8GY54_9ALTE|nr:response regulator [Catenovulum maritimum]KMT66164.1 hypothetical protein XM47_05180 [Catenovulum maritimum]